MINNQEIDKKRENQLTARTHSDQRLEVPNLDNVGFVDNGMILVEAVVWADREQIFNVKIDHFVNKVRFVVYLEGSFGSQLHVLLGHVKILHVGIVGQVLYRQKKEEFVEVNHAQDVNVIRKLEIVARLLSDLTLFCAPGKIFRSEKLDFL